MGKQSMKVRSIIIAAMFASTAYAGGYQDLVDAQNACEREGRMAAEAFTHDTIFGWDYAQIVNGGPNGEVPKEHRVQFFSIYMNAKSSSITTEHAAHMDAWARCMDRIKRK